jgi:hypothetical protein
MCVNVCVYERPFLTLLVTQPFLFPSQPYNVKESTILNRPFSLWCFKFPGLRACKKREDVESH